MPFAAHLRFEVGPLLDAVVAGDLAFGVAERDEAVGRLVGKLDFLARGVLADRVDHPYQGHCSPSFSRSSSSTRLTVGPSRTGLPYSRTKYASCSVRIGAPQSGQRSGQARSNTRRHLAQA